MKYDLTLEDDADSRLCGSTRILRAFEFLDCKTIQDVVSHPQRDWMKCPGFGRKSLEVLKSCLQSHGFVLAKQPSTSIRGWKLPPRPPEPKVVSKSVPQVVLDRNRSDDVLEAAVEMVRAIQVFQQSKSKEDIPRILRAEKGLRLYFPSLSREETQRLAHVLVHIGSLSLRHALGMEVVVPGRKKGLEPVPKIARDEQGRRRNVRLEDGSEIALEEAVEVLFKEYSRLTAPEVFARMRDRGWTFLDNNQVKNHIGVIRDCLTKSPKFSRCKVKRRKQSFGGKGGSIVFRLTR